MKNKKVNVRGFEIIIFRKNLSDYISLTDMAKFKNTDDPRYVIQNWMKTRFTVDFLGIWEQIYNNNFNRVEFDTFRLEVGTNAFVMTPQKWISKTNAIGLISKAGRYGGGTFAHQDIAFEFASWLSPEFKLYLIKEFQRLKFEENERLSLGWDVKRQLTKINYRIHTDAIKENLIPNSLTKKQTNVIYASEADVLNVALFGKTAKDWREENINKEGNIRDYCDVTQLVVLANLEGINAQLIRQNLLQSDRLSQLNKIAISQMKSLVNNSSIKKLESRN
ncbi:MAG: KilA-N domain-containing protein [Patescibacteria group bacterium]